MVDNKEEKKQEKELKFKDLPDELKKKYKNHPLFQKQKGQKAINQLTPEEKKMLNKLKQKKEKSIEERLKDVEIFTTEQTALESAFKILAGDNLTKKNKQGKDVAYFNAQRIANILSQMGMQLTKSEIDLMLWEVDENLDCQIDQNEFEAMYKRCVMEDNYLEPKSLFHMVQFLMYYSQRQKRFKDDKTNNLNKGFIITVEDTLELIYVRKGRNQLDAEIAAIFGNQEKNQDGSEKEITFGEYLTKINERAIKERKEKQLQVKENLKNMGLSTLKQSQQ